MTGTTSDAWVPTSCTLPTAERPLRVAEFDALLGTTGAAVERTSPTQLTVLLPAAPGRADAVRELAERETQCCSFFTFRLSGQDSLRLEVGVPPAHVEVLDRLASLVANQPEARS